MMNRPNGFNRAGSQHAISLCPSRYSYELDVPDLGGAKVFYNTYLCCRYSYP